MLGNLTLSQIAADLGIIVAIMAGYGALFSKLKKLIEDNIAELLAPVTKSIDDINSRIDKVDDTLHERMDKVDSEINKRMDKVDLESCKNFLVRCLSDLEKGEELSEATKIRFGEQYDHYIGKGENSYIKSATERFREEGKL